MTQVISSINFNNSKINHGEEATPQVLNRPLLAAMDADARLEESVQYVARSMSLATTETTRLLTHFNDDGVDLVGSIPPVASVPVSEMFVDDGIFYSSAFIQSSCANVLGSIANFDSSLKTLNGWTAHNAAGASVVMNNKGLTVTNTGIKTAITPGVQYYDSAQFAVSVGAKFYFSVEGYTEDNLAYNGGIVAGINMVFVDGAGNAIQVVTATTSANKFRGLLKQENVVVPANSARAFMQVYVYYPGAYSKASFTFKNVMCGLEPTLHTWTATTRPASTLVYPRAIDLHKKVASTMCWTKFNSNAAVSHTGPIGPLFLVNNGNTFNLGAVHDVADGTLYKFKLRLIQNGNVIYGNDIILPPTCMDTYIPTMLRLSEMDNGTNMVVRMEFIAIDLDLNVYKSTIELPTFTLPDTLDIRVGCDMATTDYFNGPVSELRYDEEWLNDFEFTIIALSKRAFSIEDEQYIGLDDLKTYLDGIGINLIKNPDGRLGMYHWQGYEKGKLNNVIYDPEIGSGFLWCGTAAQDNWVMSEPAMALYIKPNKPYTLRCKLGSDIYATGKFGVALRFYRADGTQTGATEVAICINGLEPDYYVISTTAPADAATAKAFMYVENGFNATRATWSKLKLELGSEPTVFTDEYSAKHAMLAP